MQADILPSPPEAVREPRTPYDDHPFSDYMLLARRRRGQEKQQGRFAWLDGFGSKSPSSPSLKIPTFILREFLGDKASISDYSLLLPQLSRAFPGFSAYDTM